MIELFTTENLLALLTLSALEIVLGIDNVVFIAILVGKLPREQRDRARQLGLAIAMLTRILLLLGITWIMLLTEPLFSIASHAFSGRDLILLFGGMFLIGKATYEIHHKIEDASQPAGAAPSHRSFAAVVAQIIMIDIIFSLDSVITAVGMSQSLPVMIIAIILAVGVMLFFSKSITDFIDKHPTFKVLALSFLLLVGVMLVAEGMGQHFERGYIYFAMGFSLFVEAVNIRVRKAHP